MIQSKIHRHVDARDVSRPGIGQFVFAKDAAERAAEIMAMIPELHKLGIVGITPANVTKMATAMDDLQGTITTASVVTPVQFLQSWLPGFVEIITQARNIDELVGMSTIGNWEDEQVVQGVLEQLGTAVPYNDYSNVPLSSWNANFTYRTIVRFEEGLQVGVLEEARAAKVQINSAEQKRGAATLALEIQRNYVGFYGFNSGNNLTYGFLNDPNLPSASAFPNGIASSSLWSSKTFGEIQKDIRLMVIALRSQSGDIIDPEKVQMTLGLASNVVDYLSTTTDQGVSVRDWMTKAYPKIRVVSAPELNLAISSSNEAYLYAESVQDTSTDDKRTWIQPVPAKFRLVGVEPKAKGYREDYSNATAGCLLKRPYAVVRRYGN